MACVVQIGAGGVGGVVAHKMAMNREVFSHIVLASRTIEKCHAIAESIRAKGLGDIVVDSVNADSVESVVALIQKHKPSLVINVALPYQDLAIMEACLQTGVHYLDTANYEHPDSAHFEYKEQWAYDTRFKQAGLFALLGSGFDPGVTNVFCAYAQKHYFDEIESIDILDCNAGDHGYAFATNFNPEINLREVSSKARYWVAGGHSALSEGNSSLGNHSPDCAEFGGQSLPTQVTPAPKSAQSKQSNTAKQGEATVSLVNTRIVGGEILDSKAISESTASDSHSESAPSVIASIAKQSTDSKKPPLVSPTDLAFNPDLQQDTIYRKFEREEKHFELDLNTQDLRTESYAGGEWRDIAPLALMKEWDYPEVGVKNSYLLYHEELESLVRNIRGLKRIRFFMTFGESYLTHMKCLENIGFLRIDEVGHKGGKIVPIEVLKTLLPDPASLASRTRGQTHIGCYIKGRKDGKERTIYIYNICNHEDCYKEVNAQGVSYTTGVPAMIGAKLIVEGKWGIGTAKLGHSACTAPLAESALSTQSRTSSALNRASLDNPQTSGTILECQDSKVADSKGISESTTSDSKTTESYNAQRLKLNADMPKGGEYQGIDNAAELVEKAEGLSLDDDQIERLRYDIFCIAKDRGYTTAYEQTFTIDKHIFTLSFACQYEEDEIELYHNKFGFVMGFYPEDFDSFASWIDEFSDEFKEQHPKSTIEWIKSERFEEKFYELIRPFRVAQGSGVWNMEQNDPDPFMHELNLQGLPYVVVEIESSGEVKVLEDGRNKAC